MENALHIPKTLGDIFGMALFAILLGITRTWYEKHGRNIINFLLCSMIGATVCYLVIGLSGNMVLFFMGCVLTGCFIEKVHPCLKGLGRVRYICDD